MNKPKDIHEETATTYTVGTKVGIVVLKKGPLDMISHHESDMESLNKAVAKRTRKLQKKALLTA